MNTKYRVGIFGATGYAGQELVKLLSHHAHVEIAFATSSSRAGKSVPSISHLHYISPDDVDFTDIDAVFLALPHTVSAPIAKKAHSAGVRVLDLSADLRLHSPQEYEKWYNIPHPNPELLPVPYGLPEIHRQEIRGANIIAVPGCYPTATLLGLYPLLSIKGIAPNNPIIVDAKSGASGAGHTPSEKTHFVELFANLVPYNVGRKHRHVGEIEQEINQIYDLGQPLIFAPHLLSVDRGLMASIYVTLNYNITADHVHNLYSNIYNDEALVRLLPLNEEATLKHAVRTNQCVISLNPIGERYVHITSVIDNLRKGASSQAVQCFNLMMDLPETTALI